MTTPAPRPRPLALRLVRLATALLPAAHRPRYRQELIAELWTLPRAGQLGFAVRALLGSMALRAALRAPSVVVVGAAIVPSAPRPPITCRMHLYHRWTTFRTDDGERYLACARCGTVKEGSGDTIGYIAPAGF